jgi:hypothetical protein
MVTISFIGTLPKDGAALAAVRSTFARFTRIKNYLLESGFKGLPDFKKNELAHEFDVDRFLIEDIVDVLDGSVPSFIDPHTPDVFWTFGRHSPRWGMPWGSLTLDDTGFCHLNIRWGGSFEDVDDPPRTVRCTVLLQPIPSITAIEEILFSSRKLDLWLRLQESSLNGILVVNRDSIEKSQEMNLRTSNESP